jgi:nitroimidazol reductase NimA-like FMN-containing flavoprotein (pyridoxamine 5'-phosphate oxidase superfamily)
VAIDRAGLRCLDENECWRFLSGHRLGRIAFVDPDIDAEYPDEVLVLPVNYVVDDRRIVLRTAPGTKLEAAIAREHAAFEVDEATELFETGTSVLVRGTLRVAREPEELAHLEALGLHHWAPGHRPTFIVLDPTATTGRRIPARAGDGTDADGG